MKRILIILCMLCFVANSYAHDIEPVHLEHENDAFGQLNSLAESYSDGYEYEVLLVSSYSIGHSNIGLRYGDHEEVSKFGHYSIAHKSLIEGKEVAVTFLTLQESELTKIGFKAAPGLIFFKQGKYIGHKVGHVYPENKIGRYYLEYLENPMTLRKLP